MNKKIGIMSSSRVEIDKKYLDLMDDISKVLAKKFDLNFGSSSNSMMGICYRNFKKENKTINAYTNYKYIDELEKLDGVNKILVNDTFDLKKELFNDSDIVLFMPGGIGTLSEFLSFLEEKRSNDKIKKLILFNYENYYGELIEIFKKMIDLNFADKNFLELFDVVTSKEELKKLMEVKNDNNG